jgi:hypothetical protein
MKLFRERLLARLIERHAISEELARRLLAWRANAGTLAWLVEGLEGSEASRR